MENNKNPWMALGTYEERHENRFKGREKDTESILNMLKQNECVVSYAASGEGKSSLINAGLCPRMRREGLFPLKIVFTTDELEGKGIPFLEDNKHINFDKLLLKKIEHCIKQYETSFKDDNKLKEYHIRFEKDERFPYTHFSKYLWWKLRTETIKIPFGEYNYIPVLIFDQFEEILRSPWVKDFFLWLEELMKDVCPEFIANEFIGDLNELPYNKLFKTLFSLRYEYVGELDYWCSQRSFIPQLMQNRYFLKPLTKANAREIITCQPGYDGLNGIADELIDYLSNDPKHNLDDESDPCISALFLSIVCSSIFEMSSEKKQSFIESLRDSKDKESSLNGIIKEFYINSLRRCVYEDDLDSVKDILENVLLDSNGIRNRISINDERIRHTPFGQYVKSLEKVRLIRTIPIHSNNKTTVYVELVHDCLSPILLEDYQKRKIKKNWKRTRNFVLVMSAFLFIAWNLYNLNGGKKGKESIIDSTIEGNPMEYVHDMSLSTINSDTLFISKCDIRRNAFRGNSSVKILVVGDSVILNSFAFAECPNLTELHLRGRGISMEFGVFSNCANLKSIFVSSSCSIKKMNYQINMTGLQKIVVENGNQHFHSYGKTTIVTDESQNEYPLDKDIRAKINNNGSYTIEGGINAPWSSASTSSHIFDHIMVVKPTNVDSINHDSSRPWNGKIALHGIIGEKWDGYQGLDRIKRQIVDLNFPNAAIVWPAQYQGMIDSCLLNADKNDSIKSNLLAHGINIDFTSCNLERVDLPEVQYVGPLAFANNKMTFIDLPKAKYIGKASFFECEALSDVNLPSAVVLDNRAFALCNSLNNINAPNVTAVKVECFADCGNLKTVKLKSARKVERGAFYKCKELTSVYLPSLENLGEDAFFACPNLQNLTVPRALANVIIQQAEYYGLNQLYVKNRNGHLITLSSVKEYQRVEQPVFSADSCNSWLKEMYIDQGTNSFHGGWDADGFSLKWLEKIQVSRLNKFMFDWKNNLLSDDGDLLAYAQNNKVVFVPNTDSIIALGNDVEKVYLLNASSLWNILPNENSKKLPRVYLPYGSEGIANKYYSNGIFETVESLSLPSTIYYRTSFATKALLHKVFIHNGYILGASILIGLILALLLLALLAYFDLSSLHLNFVQVIFIILLYGLYGILAWALLLSQSDYDPESMSWGTIAMWVCFMLLPTQLSSNSSKSIFYFLLFFILMPFISRMESYSIEERLIIFFSFVFIMSYIQKYVISSYCKKQGIESLTMTISARFFLYALCFVACTHCLEYIAIENKIVHFFTAIAVTTVLMTILLVLVVHLFGRFGKLKYIGIAKSDDG